MNRLFAALLTTAMVLAVYSYFNPLRVEHWAMISISLVLLAIPRFREFGVVILPAFGSLFVYDFLRVFAESAAGRVSLELVPSAEIALFGIPTDQGVLMPHQFIQATMINPVLDLIGGAFYTSHAFIVFGFALFLVIRAHRTNDPADRERIYPFLWGFLLMNLLANFIQLVWPVAPPWYIEAHGFVAPDGAIPGDAAGLSRVDEILGIAYFTPAYLKSAYAFGAMPSLHVGFPAWVTLNAQSRRGKMIGWTVTAIMSFYAVYLNHHYVLDVGGGLAVAAITFAIIRSQTLGDVPQRIHEWILSLFKTRTAIS